VKAQLENIVLEMYRAGVWYDDALKKFQSVFIVTVLREHNGNQSRAAAELGMHRNNATPYGSYFGDRPQDGP